MPSATTSFCPVCLAIIPASKRIAGSDVILDKTCPEHGQFATRIAKDARRFFDKTFELPGKPFIPLTRFNGECGRDCGWCDAHRQHVCTGLIEITDCCDLDCPICYFGDKGKHHLSEAEFRARLDTLLAAESGKLEVLQISGGECLTHPDFARFVDIALTKDIGRILINTNGLGFLRNPATFEKVRKHRDRVEVYLQFDGFSDEVYCTLRGRPLLDDKLAIIEKLNAAEIKIGLAVTVYRDNLDQIPAILKLATETAHISGVTFQRLTKVGTARGTELASVLQEDILLAIASSGLMAYTDMVPLPCSHENCTSLGFLFVIGDQVYSVADYVDLARVKATLSNRIAFDKTILDYVSANICDCFVGPSGSVMLDRFRDFATGGASRHNDMKIVRLLVKNFMDAETFDFDRVTKCCTGVATGGGKIVPFCLHNALKEKAPWTTSNR